MGIDNRKNKGEIKVLGIIPARYGSTRLPGKPLADIAGKPMIQWVYERAVKAEKLDCVIVATDDERILKTVESFGGRAVMTSPHHPTGTDRLAEAADLYPEMDIIINIQGDEPLLNPATIDAVASLLLADKNAVMSTACTRIGDPDLINSPTIVKVVLDREMNALYFSRAPIPYFRRQTDMPVYRHIGLYGYRRDFLFTFTRLKPVPLEQTESLEQLRALYYGYRIKTAVVEEDGLSVDTPEDLFRVREMITVKGIDL